jgi:hypothetical protein
MITARFLTAGLLGLAITIPFGPTPLDPKLGDTQKIKQWGYSIRTVEGWNAIPAEPGEKLIVGRWKADMEAGLKRGDMSAQLCEVTIVRVPIRGSTTPKTDSAPTKDEGEDEKPAAKVLRGLGKNFEKLRNPKSAEDYLDGRFEGANARWSVKDVKAGSLAGKLYEFGSGAEAVWAGLFKTPDIEWLIVYSAFEEYRKVWAAVYLQSIQSFKLFEPEGRPPTIAADTDPKKLKGDEKRKFIKAGIAGSPGWYSIDTKNYVFLSNAPAKDFVQQLAREIEVIREKVYVKLFPPLKALDAICTVRVLATQNEYHQYGGPGGSAGYWNSEKEELVLFDGFEGVSKKNSKAFTKSVMYHEAFHQYIHYAVGDLAPHSWYNEGHGDYFAGMSVGTDKVTPGMFEWRVDFLKRHLREKKDLIPLKSLVRFPQSEYYTNASLKYSQGWAFIYFLRNVTKNKRWQEINDIYFKYLSENIAAFKKGKDGQKEGDGGESVPGIPGITLISFEDQEKVEQILKEAVDKAFDGVDFDKLDKEFQSWVATL